MPPFLRILVSASALCLSGSIAAADSPAPTMQATTIGASGFSAQRLGTLHAFMHDATEAKGYLGGVTLIARDGRLVDWQTYGYEDLQRSRPMRRDAIFRIYSMTKPITSVAALMLLEEGKLTLDDPVAKWLPALAGLPVASGDAAAPTLRKPATVMTVRHLLTHTAGFPAGLPGDDAALQRLEASDPESAADLGAFAERVGKSALAADPGTRFGYDGTATQLLARVVEVASGQDFETFVQARILGPLAMNDTGFSVPESKRARVVDITVMGPAGKLVLDDGPSAKTPGARLNAYASGAGGLYSTAGDYLRFCQMLLDHGRLDGVSLLGRKTVDLMFMNHLSTILDPPVTQYSPSEGFGLGGYIVLDVAGRGSPGSLGQFGWSGAASTNFLIDREERMIAILMLQHLPNGRADDLPRIGRKFQTLVYQGLVP